MHDLDIVILAAGQGTRMRSDLPKVLHLLARKPLLQHVLDTSLTLNPKGLYVVVGHQAEKVINECNHYSCQWVLQKEQLGTGHAVSQALAQLQPNGRTLVLYGDVPLVRKQTLENLINNTPKDAVGLLTAISSNPFGLGRIIRDDAHKIIKITEEKDATIVQKQIREINTGIYILPNNKLKEWLPRLENSNSQKEYYLTDVIKMAVADKVAIFDFQVIDESEILGINDRQQLNTAERVFLRRKAVDFIEAGVEVVDPARFDIRGEASIQAGTTVDINVLIDGKVEIGANVKIGPNCYLRDCKIEDGAEILANSMVEESSIGKNARIGPFARIRPGSEVSQEAHVGNFVELKKTFLGEGSKANHLSYLGDAIIGKHVNIGAGTITCNYDGVNKYITEIEDGAFIGSNSALIAPLKIEKDALIGAGSVITVNAPAEKITLARAKQVTLLKGQPAHLKKKKQED
jgi:bifunctional UDP-N-acetylglucosamine pyrophosphorylase/glucosamine-1-phosphate N-acetyltransferase